MLTLIDLSTTKPVLQPRMPSFCGALRKCMYEWNTGFAPYHADLDEEARAVVINRLWYRYSSQALRGDPGISLHKYSNGYFYAVDDRLLIRFKHLDDSYQSRNHPTPRSRAWDGQLRFRTIPDLVRLEFGYRLDITGTIVLDALVALKLYGDSIWRWQVWGRPISEFAATPRNMTGRLIYSYDNYSGAAMP